jgi:glycosyltransferase involved in cell wall biosynthesis
MASAPTVSVFVLNYNYARYLPQCLDSILAQTYRDFELVIVDDCSRDSSLEVIKPYLADSRLRLVANPINRGFAYNLIAATESLTSGEFVIAVSADDLICSPDAFRIQLDLMRKHPQAAFCFSGVQLWKGKEKIEEYHSFPAEVTMDAREGLHALLRGGVWPLASGTMVRRSAYQACGGYSRDLAMVLDLQLWLALVMEGGFTYSPEPLLGYRLHDSQMSAALPGIRKNAREVVKVLRAACLAGESRGLGTGGLARQAIGFHLAYPAMQEAFQGLRATAARRWLAAALESPVETAMSRKLWIVAARVAMGDRLTAYSRELVAQTKRLVVRLTGDHRS